MRSIIPKSVQTKIYKTGQTRGADDDGYIRIVISAT